MINNEIIFSISDKEKFLSLTNEIKEIYPYFSEAMIKHGWLPPVSKTKDFMFEIVMLNKENPNDSELINNYILSQYNKKNISSLETVWKFSPIIMSRFKILQEVLWNHKKGNFAASIATIYPQIEGFIFESNNYIGRANSNTLKIFIDELKEKESIENIFGSYDFSIVSDFINNTMLANFSHGHTINSTCSRHAILHGADKNYYNEKNSLNLILLFDILQYSYSSDSQRLIMELIK